MDLPEVASVARLSLRPGDRLVLSFKHPLSQDEYDRMVEHVTTWGLPEGVRVVILDNGASLEVLAREDG